MRPNTLTSLQDFLCKPHRPVGDDPAGDMKENSDFLQVLVSPTPGKRKRVFRTVLNLLALWWLSIFQ